MNKFIPARTHAAAKRHSAALLACTALTMLTTQIAGAQQYWNGSATTGAGTGTVNGGNGTWNAVNGNWTDVGGLFNAAYTNPTNVVFSGLGDIVAVDNSSGQIGVTGITFATGSYSIAGADLELAAPMVEIRIDGNYLNWAIIDAALTGTGGLHKTGGGWLLLRGANTYTGETVVDNGKIEAWNFNAFSQQSALTINAAGTVDMGSTFGYTQTVDSVTLNGGRLQSANLTGAVTSNGGILSGLSGTASLTVLSGSTYLEGTYSGATVIEGGTLWSGARNGLSAASLTTVKTGGTLELFNSQTVNSILLEGGLIADGELTGNITSKGGTIRDVNLVGGGLDVVSGTTRIIGSNAFLVNTEVHGGALMLDGTLDFNVRAFGGTVGGVGEARNILLGNGAVLAPGNSIGILKVTDDLEFGSGALLRVEVAAGGNLAGTHNDQVEIGGNLLIDSLATVHVLAENGTDDGRTYAPNTTYTILKSSNRTGDFAGVTDNFAFLDSALSYDASNVYLTLTRNAATNGDIARTANQKGVAGAFDGFNPTDPVSQQMLGLSDDGARSAFDSVSGDFHASSQNMIWETFNLFQSGMGSSGFGGSGSATTAPLAYGPEPGTAVASLLAIDEVDNGSVPRHSAWLSPLVGRGSIKGDDNARGLEWAAGGLSAGYEGHSTIGAGEASFGLGLGYIAGWAQSDGGVSEQNSDGLYAGIFGGWDQGPISLKGNLAVGADSVSTRRNITVGAITETAVSDYWRHSVGLGLEAAYAHQLTEAFSLGPVARLDLGWSGHNGFSETGAGALNATVGALDAWQIDTGIGVQLGYATTLANGGEVTATGRALWQHGFGDTTVEQSVTLAGGGSAFTVAGAEVGRDRLQLGAGVSYSPTQAVTMSLDYAGRFSGSQNSHVGTAGFKLAF